MFIRLFALFIEILLKVIYDAIDVIYGCTIMALSAFPMILSQTTHPPPHPAPPFFSFSFFFGGDGWMSL